MAYGISQSMEAGGFLNSAEGDGIADLEEI